MTTMKQHAVIPMVKDFFWNSDENRLRVGWRIVTQAAILLAMLAGLRSLVFPFLRDYWLKSHPQVFEFVRAGSQGFCVIVSLVFAAWLIDRRPIKSFGFALTRRWWLDFCFSLALGALLMAGVFGAEYMLGWITVTVFFQTAAPSFVYGIALYVTLFFSASIAEEVMSRGYWLRNLAEGLNISRIGSRTALLLSYGITSLIFSLLHLGNSNISWVSIINLVMLGLLFGLPYVLTGELAISIGLHFAWNLFQGNVFGFPVSGLAPKTAYISIQQNGRELWTGGMFGPEGGVVGLIAILIGVSVIATWLKSTRGNLAWQNNLANYSSTIEEKRS